MDIRDHTAIKPAHESWTEKISRFIHHSLRDYRLANTYESYWWFCGRKEFIYSLLASLKPTSETLILDAGCGTGEDLKFVEKLGRLVAVDIQYDSLKNIGKKRIQSDLKSLPFRDQTFDIIISFDVLEHIQEDQQVVKEFRRVLKQGGTCLVSVPAHRFLYSTHDQFLGHVRRYGRKEFLSLFHQASFEPMRVTYWNFFAFVPIAAIRVFRKFVFWGIKNQPLSDIAKLPYAINYILMNMLRLENFLIIKQKLTLPYGISLFGIFKKSEK